MSLAPGEERTLTAIEDRLRRTDLRLAVKFTLFAISMLLRRQGPLRERVSPWQARRRRARRAVLAALLLLLALCVTMALLTGGVI